MTDTTPRDLALARFEKDIQAEDAWLGLVPAALEGPMASREPESLHEMDGR